MKYYYIIFGFIFNIFALFFLGCRSKLIFKELKEKLKIYHAIMINAVVTLLNYLTPFKIGSLSYPVAANKIGGMKIENGMKVALFEPLFDLIWQLLLLIFFVFYFSFGYNFLNNSLRFFVYILILLLVLFLILYNYRWLLVKILRFLPRWIIKKGKSLGINKEKLNEIPSSIFHLSKRKSFILFYSLLTIIIIFLAPLGLYFSILVFEYKFNLFSIVGIYWISFILGRLSGLPGGIGVRDVSMGLFLSQLGVNSLNIIGIVAIYRLINSLPTLMFAGIYILVLGRDLFGYIMKLKKSS